MVPNARRLALLLPLLLACGCNDTRDIGGAMVGAALPVALAYTAVFLGVSRLLRPPPEPPWGQLGALVGGLGAGLALGSAARWSWIRDGLAGDFILAGLHFIFPWMVAAWLLGRRLRPNQALLFPAAFVLAAWQLPALLCVGGMKELCLAQQAAFATTVVVLTQDSDLGAALMLLAGAALVLGEALWAREHPPSGPTDPPARSAR